MNNFFSAAIVECNVHYNSRIIFSKLFCFYYLLLNFFRKLITRPNGADDNILTCESFFRVTQIIHEQIHQKIHLVLRTFPVFCRKCVHCYILYAHFIAFCYNFFQCVGACLMSCTARKSAFFCPSAVAIHDNPNMHGNPCIINFRKSFFLKKHIFYLITV